MHTYIHNYVHIHTYIHVCVHCVYVPTVVRLCVFVWGAVSHGPGRVGWERHECLLSTIYMHVHTCMDIRTYIHMHTYMLLYTSLMCNTEYNIIIHNMHMNKVHTYIPTRAPLLCLLYGFWFDYFSGCSRVHASTQLFVISIVMAPMAYILWHWLWAGVVGGNPHETIVSAKLWDRSCYTETTYGETTNRRT